MATVDAIITMPMIFMNGWPLVKKNTTEPPMPSVGSNCISTLSWCPRGNSGGGCRTTSPVGTSDGSARGGRLTTMWLTAHQFPSRARKFPSATPCQADAAAPGRGTRAAA
ncbi:hypothetical protein GCM10010508_67030 [Streptomyces naganishii JCM 4654]|uniref:Uncharacterized protein n=1 Tax=Streptomyces naganishii JCM 4654 TaxID=1306179 RepID=A0A919CYN1_9ACTN|nr:hypothetical protein GCM10010508_67030 [Streptomyces naganishii JCM 4654]